MAIQQLDKATNGVLFQEISNALELKQSWSSSYILARLPSFVVKHVTCPYRGISLPPITLQSVSDQFISPSRTKEIDLEDSVGIQLVGVDLSNIAPELLPQLQLLVVDFLQGGTNCGLQYVTRTARPNPIGPFWCLSVTASGSKNHTNNVDVPLLPLTLGGGGTLDTTIMCTQGMIEVLVVSRQKPEVLIQTIRKMIETSQAVQDRRKTVVKEDQEPFVWPSKDAMETSKLHIKVFELNVGDVLHIPKGCAFSARRTQQQTKQTPNCLVYWHWMFTGTFCESTEQEFKVALSFAQQNRLQNLPSLGISEQVIHQSMIAVRATLLAKQEWNIFNTTQQQTQDKSNNNFQFWIDDCQSQQADQYESSTKQQQIMRTDSDVEYLRACLKLNIELLERDEKEVLVSLKKQKTLEHQFVSTIDQIKKMNKKKQKLNEESNNNIKKMDENEMETVTTKRCQEMISLATSIENDDEKDDDISLHCVVDSSCAPDWLNAIDPFSAEGFACAACGYEVANSYFHCTGCERLLGQDYNLCAPCHTNLLKQFQIRIDHHTESHGDDAADEGRPGRGERRTQEYHFIPQNEHLRRSSVIGAYSRCSNGKYLSKQVVKLKQVNNDEDKHDDDDDDEEEDNQHSNEGNVISDIIDDHDTRNYLLKYGVVHHPCRVCLKCDICACLCHLKFELRCRFQSFQQMRQLVHHSESIVSPESARNP